MNGPYNPGEQKVTHGWDKVDRKTILAQAQQPNRYWAVFHTAYAELCTRVAVNSQDTFFLISLHLN